MCAKIEKEKIQFPLTECRFAGRNEWGPQIDCDHRKNEMKICNDDWCPLHKIKEVLLRCYFVEAKDMDDPNGVAVIAKNPTDAKRYALTFLAEYDVLWTDLRPSITKNANIEGLSNGMVFGADEMDLVDALHRHIYNRVYCLKCPNCGVEETEVYEVYPDVFGCSMCEENLTKESINNPYAKKQEASKTTSEKDVCPRCGP